MTKPESPFLLVNPATTEITKTSLSALIQHKMQVSKTYPAMVKELVNGVAFVEVLPPLLRQIQDDHPQVASSSTMRIHANVRVGEAVLIQVQSGEWVVNTTLTDEVYQERLRKDLNERLLMESHSIATLPIKRASKRGFENLLGLTPSESTPWAVPGRMNNNQKLVSKKILQWCVNKTGLGFQQRLQEGFPSSLEWGNFEHFFAVYLNGDNEQFTTVAITQDEHKALVEAWADILRNTKRSVPVPLKRPPAPSQASPAPISPKQTAIVAAPSLPQSVITLAQSFHLPLPNKEASPTLTTLAAWAESDHLILKERATDLLLMTLSGGEPVRQHSNVQRAWAEWHKHTDSINQLCSLVQEGEELPAVRALAGRAFLDTQTASSVCDQLLLRWRRQLIQQHNLADSALGRPVQTTATHLEYRRAMRLHGIQCADTWLDQLLLAIQAAPQMGMPILLIGDVQSSKILVELLAHIFAGGTYSQIRLPRNRAQMFGKPSSSGDIYLHSDFGLAIRQGGYQQRYGEVGLWNPHFLWMDNLYPHAKRDGLALMIQEMYFGQGIELYSQEDHQRYHSEYLDLQQAPTLTATEQTRRDELEHFFDAKTIGGIPIEDAWRLHATENTILFGHISAEQIEDTPLSLVQRSMVIEVPTFSVERIQYRLGAVEDWVPLREGKRTLQPKHTWKMFPTVRNETFAILDALHGKGITVNDLLAKQIAFFLAGAEAWSLPDNALLTTHLCQTLLLPRLLGKSEDILEGIDQLESIDTLTPQLRMYLGSFKKQVVRHGGQKVHGLLKHKKSTK